MELVQNFLPVADEVFRLQRGNDDECRLFQKFADQGHYRTPGTTRQGTYAVTPNGTLLASINSTSPERIAGMMESALARWKDLTPEERLFPKESASDEANIRRFEGMYPKDGLVLKVNTRDFPRENVQPGWRADAWNQDYAWFKKDEARAFLPRRIHVGARQQLATPVVNRLARFCLVDNVRGQTNYWPAGAVQQAELISFVTAVEGNLVTLRLRGAAWLEWDFRWTPERRRNREPQRQSSLHGYNPTLFGRAQYDLATERFVSFEMVASGRRWGRTSLNGRTGDEEGGPMGVAFALGRDIPAEHVTPAHFNAYGWR